MRTGYAKSPWSARMPLAVLSLKLFLFQKRHGVTVLKIQLSSETSEHHAGRRERIVRIETHRQIIAGSTERRIAKNLWSRMVVRAQVGMKKTPHPWLEINPLSNSSKIVSDEVDHLVVRHLRSACRPSLLTSVIHK